MAIKLGLPVEYKKHPQLFDAWNIGSETDAKNAVIEKILRKHSAKEILDLTCGTGAQVFFLARRGYKIIGADFSPDLIKIAKTKAKKEQMQIKFLNGDMRTLQVGQFDAVITISSAIGHLTRPAFEKALRNIHRNLKDDGIYVFDIFNLEAMTDKAVADLACYKHKVVGDSTIHGVQFSTINRESGHLTSYDYYVIQRGAEKPSSFSHKFSLQLYSEKQLQEVLSQNGFRVLEKYQMDGAKFSRKTSQAILLVAQKSHKNLKSSG